MHEHDALQRYLAWLGAFTPATRAAARALPSLSGERLLVVCHLDSKMVPYFEALVGAGAEVWAHAANPATTRNAVAAHLGSLGVDVPAREDDPPKRHAAHLERAIAAGPTLLSEMGADATAATGGGWAACAAASRRPGPG